MIFIGGPYKDKNSLKNLYFRNTFLIAIYIPILYYLFNAI